MTVLYPSNQRGFADHGWLKSFHTFNFASYYDPTRKRFGMLRVVNQDRVAPSMGFDTHAHANMEIVSIPLSGRLHHRDSQGHDSYIEAGEVQLMSAGSGIQHSEYNASDKEETHFLQIWVFPNKENTPPGYQQKKFSHFEDLNSWKLLVSPDGREGSLKILQDAFFIMGSFKKDYSHSYQKLSPKNGLFAFCVEGQCEIDNQNLAEGDALGLEDFNEIKIECQQNSKILLIEVPLAAT